ncbi:MAG: hypothetical protein JWM05_2106, partial [Acidimicrobiales bacterium]|nr:hypothetical protein [Acidimicrobiales bacterium]
MTEPVAAGPRWSERIITLTSPLAGLALVLIVIGAVFLLIPVRNPRVQDCGVPAKFLLAGRTDVYVDPNHPPKGFDAAQATAANRNRCQKRVAARAVPGGALVVGGALIGTLAAFTEWMARGSRRRSLLAAHDALPAAPPPAAPPPPPP